MTSIAIAGAAGRMGRALVEAAVQDENTTVVGAVEHAASGFLGSDAGELAGCGKLHVPITDSMERLDSDYDVLIDFTLPESTVEHLQTCRKLGKRMVIGTTGLSEPQKQVVAEAGEDIAVVFAPNMSIGVNLCFKLLETAAKVLGDDVDIEIIEAHHRNKLDAPSGTALRMGEVVAGALDRDLSKCAVYGREGRTGVRNGTSIGFETIRAGDIVGEHTVMFCGTGERVEFVHKASSRDTFVNGAIRAARWIVNQKPGLYSMLDMLEL